MIRKRIHSVTIQAIRFDPISSTLTGESGGRNHCPHQPVKCEVYQRTASFWFPERIYRRIIADHEDPAAMAENETYLIS
jgi:hypothetical protein